MNMAVHSSVFSILGSCSISMFGSRFGVRGSMFARTQNPEPNIEHTTQNRTMKLKTNGEQRR
jgi:hypothetical protein